MKYCAIICALIHFFSIANAQQNMILNGGFEIHNSCMINGVEDAPPWTFTSCSPTLFDTCATVASRGVPFNSDSLFGYQWPHSGSSYAGLNLYLQSATVREYLVYPINGDLISGKTYCLNFFVNLFNASRYGIDCLGAYFSNQLITCSPNCLCILNFQPTIMNPNGNIITDTLGWTEITGCYMATGMENYLILGNFKPDSLIQRDTNRYVQSEDWSTFYYIDDISLIEDTTSGIVDVNTGEFFSISPNPSTNFISIKTSVSDIIKKFIITNIAGNRVLERYELENQTVDLSMLDNGFYFYQCFFESGKKTNGKLIISK